MPSIAVLDDYLNASRRFADWRVLGEETRVTVFREPIALEARAETLAPFEVICAMRERTPINAALLRQLPNLKLIVTAGMRNDAIDMAAAAAQGVTVCGTESPGHATAELTIALMLAAARRLPQNIAALRAGGWQNPPHAALGHDLRGRRLGVIGLGRLGAQVAQISRALGMEVLAWSENLTDERAEEVGVPRAASLPELLARADVATIHLRLSPRSRGLIGAAELARMKPGAILINTSRAPIIDVGALLDALRREQIACAALDVHPVEPLPADHALRSETLMASGRLILTPHIGYVTEETFAIFYSQMVEATAAWASGAPIRVIAAPSGA